MDELFKSFYEALDEIKEERKIKSVESVEEKMETIRKELFTCIADMYISGVYEKENIEELKSVWLSLHEIYRKYHFKIMDKIHHTNIYS